MTIGTGTSERRAPSKRRRAASGHRPIGVFTAELDDAYQIEVCRGIEAEAHRRGVGVISFLGSRVNSTLVSEAAANVAYRIADRLSIDGLIVITSAIATFLDRDGLARLFTRADGIPQVSVGVKIPGVSSLSVDGSAGIAEVVRHLARDHGRRRFALVGGPPGHAEGEQRARAFREALAGEGIAFDERLEARGDFLQESGTEAARTLRRCGLPFDALVCLNDRMALGAIGALRRDGVRVPEEISVVGFDGIEAGQYVTPPLTTVLQPLHELGAQAVDALLELLHGAAPRDRTLFCAPEIRQSCGCPPGRSRDADSDAEDAAALARSTEAERGAVEELASHASRGDSNGFIARLNAELFAAPNDGRLAERWNRLLSVVRRRARTAGAASAGDRKAECAADGTLFERARELIGEIDSRFQAAQRMIAEERFAMLREISVSLVGAFELPVMLSRLESGLERLGIGGGYLALFEAPDAQWSRLLLAPRSSGLGELPPKGKRFRTAQLVPARAGNAWREGCWILEPLVFRDEPLGFLLLRSGAQGLAVYDTLREQVASAVKGALLLEQVRTHEHRLEAEVKRRTAELMRANRELTREIERRVRLEEEVIDISNRTMQRIGQDIHDDLCQHLAGIAMLSTALREELSGIGPGQVAAIDRISNLLADSIARAKQIARGLLPTGLARDGLSAAIEELVAVARQRYQGRIEFRASPDFLLPDTDRALQVYRIVQEALSNAINHSHSNRVEVTLRREPGEREEEGPQLVAEVVDDGVGLPQLIAGNGMGLRIMRYRAEKAGAQLRIEALDPGTRVSCRFAPAHGGAR